MIIKRNNSISELSGFNDKQAIKFNKQKITSKKWLKCLIGTAGAWFLLDVALYGNGISSMIIMNNVASQFTLVQHTLMSALLFLCFAVPGYILAAKYVNRIGRKRLLMMEFSVMTACYLFIAFIPNTQTTLPLFIVIFGISFFFINFGPNTTTFLIPAEIYPTNIRARSHGISAAVGKMGAFVGVFFMPFILKNFGLSTTMGLVALASLAGVAISLLVPEMKNISLETTETIEYLTLIGQEV